MQIGEPFCEVGSSRVRCNALLGAPQLTALLEDGALLGEVHAETTAAAEGVTLRLAERVGGAIGATGE